MRSAFCTLRVRLLSLIREAGGVAVVDHHRVTCGLKVARALPPLGAGALATSRVGQRRGTLFNLELTGSAGARAHDRLRFSTPVTPRPNSSTLAIEPIAVPVSVTLPFTTSMVTDVA